LGVYIGFNVSIPWTGVTAKENLMCVKVESPNRRPLLTFPMLAMD